MGAKFVLEGSGQGAVKVVEYLTKALDNNQLSAERAVKSASRLENQAKRIAEAVNPLEKYSNKMKELAQHVQSGRLNMDYAQRAAEKYNRELHGVGNSGDRAFGAQAIATIKNYALGMVSIGTAVSLIRGEMQALIELGQRTSRAQLGAADSEAALRETIATDPQRDWMIAQANRIAKERNLPVAGIYNAVEQSYGAGGDATLAIATVEEGTRQTRNIERVVQFAAGVGDIVQATNIKDVEEAAGFLAITQATSRIKGEKVAAAASKTAAAFTAQGGSEAAAAAMLSALSVAGADPEGDRSRTAAIQFITKSEDFFDKRKMRKYGLSAEQVDTPDERMALLQGSAEMGADFLASATFEAAMTGAMRKTIQDDSTKQLYASAFRANDQRDERLKAAAERRGYVTSGDLQQTKQTEDILSSTDEALSLGSEAVISDEERTKLRSRVGQLFGSQTKARTRMFSRTGLTLERSEVEDYIQGELSEFYTRERENEILSLGFYERSAEKDAIVKELQNAVQELQGLNTKTKAKVTTRAE